MVSIKIVLDNSRVFLFPASAQSLPGDDDHHDHPPAPSADTTVRGGVVISTDKAVKIGPVRIVWEVAREMKTKSNQWGTRNVLARFESEVTADDTWIPQGDISLPFTFQIPSLLPPTSDTVFDRTSHTLVASVLESAPEYVLGPVPEYDQSQSIPNISPRGSISSFADWSFPGSQGSRRSSLMTDLSGSGQNSRRSSISSNLGSSENGSRRGSRGSEILEPQKKGLFGGLRRKSRTPSTSDEITEAPARRMSSQTTPIVPTELVHNGVTLAEYLLPSTAANTASLEIVSCPAPTGEISTLDWSKNSNTAGLGRSQKHVHTNILSLGSGVNFEYNLQDIPDKTTIHDIRLSLCQKTRASNGDSEEEIFELFARGSPVATGGKMSTDGHVWRGEAARTWDALPIKGKKSAKSAKPQIAAPQILLPGVTSGTSSLRIRAKARLPTPMAGAVPSSPKLLDNRLARVVHRLRIETFFSVLGEDESGRPLAHDPKAKNGKPREGTMRRTWVDHDITIGSCCITPENVLVPTYIESPEWTLGDAQQRARIQTRESLSDFAMPKHCTHTVKSTGGDRVTDKTERSPIDAKDRLARHSCETDSRCLCFHGDAVIGRMIGSLEKPEREGEEILPLFMETGGLVIKQLYTPSSPVVTALPATFHTISGTPPQLVRC